MKTNKEEAEELVIKERAIQEGAFMKAPNGKNSNLTENQWLQVRTNNFINWFGDWINSPEESSKVLDENGEPLVVYHGTNIVFNTFNSFSWFADDKNYIIKGESGASGRNIIMNVFLNIVKPSGWVEYDALLIDQIIHKGYDSVILEDDVVVYFVFEPNQIKSATNNNGEFNPNSNNINK